MMKTRLVGMMALAGLLAVAITAPGMAQGKSDDKGRVQVHVQLGAPAPMLKADEMESRAFRSWFEVQIRRYDDRDRDTGERLGDLLQMVMRVDRDSFMVIDQRNEPRTILVNRNTNIISEYDRRRAGGRWGTPNLPTNALIKRGDLVTVLGYLRANGDILATQVRVLGNAGGWFGYDDFPYQTFDGFRAYGDVVAVDLRGANLVVNANIGRRTIQLARGGEVIVNGRNTSLDALRRGDRVVFYYRDQRPGALVMAYRVVLLNERDRYPEGDRPHWADPDYRQDPWDFGGYYGKDLTMDGRLVSLGNGLFFNRIVLSTGPNRTVTVHFAKAMEVYDRDGTRISPFKLREGQWLRVTYTETDGSLFAKRIEVR